MLRSLVIISLALVGEAAPSPASSGLKTTCGDMKEAYRAETCCGSPKKEIGHQLVPDPKKRLGLSTNPCEGKQPKPGAGFDNHDCVVDGVVQAVEQSGADVSDGVKGGVNATTMPLTDNYWKKGLCPVNVHWHLGAEHRSKGQFDENGKARGKAGTPDNTHDPNSSNFTAKGGRRMAADGKVRYGFACHHYDEKDSKFTTDYKWQHCVGMHVGETYEVHWPHSALGACHTPHQYQTPFYDGVFCGWNDAVAKAVGKNLQTLTSAVGVQAQIFTIVNDESYYFPDLLRGAVVDGEMWKDVAAYTGSTTGTTRDNKKCSKYGPITWQVDRKCHMISASTFDKMCADMKQQADDMSGDLYAHGARELVDNHLTANNHKPASR